MTNGAAAVRQTTYVNTTTYHGLLNTSVQVCDGCVWKKRLRIVAVATFFMVGALVLLVLAWRLLLFSVLLAWIGGWRMQAWKTAGERVAVKRSKRQLAARGYPYTRIGHIHASYPKVSCDPPHCDGLIGRAETQGMHTVSGFV